MPTPRLTEADPRALAAWMTEQRWFAHKGREVDLEEIASVDLPSPRHPAEGPAPLAIRVHLVAERVSGSVYQVPLVYRGEAVADGDPAHVAVLYDGTSRVHVLDGPRDPAYAAALLDLVLSGGSAKGADAEARGHRSSAVDDLRVRTARVLSGEQSNTSIIYRLQTPDGADAAPAIVKVFRTVHEGSNPDVELQTALSQAGSALVPEVLGHVDGRWPSGAGPVHGDLAFAQRFVEGVEDAWRVALGSAERDEDFSARARDLGRATADLHRELAELRPVEDLDTPEPVLASMRARFEAAAEAVPDLVAHREAVEAVLARAAAAEWPGLQRIHGDYHLGQVLSTPDDRWFILDFEGEPLRPMAERTRPDIALRDVAGMLRSFDYVAGTYARTPRADSARRWADLARSAFLDGYLRESGVDAQAAAPVLDAFELDKALYEAVYEARNRPAWLPIPVGAIDRLTSPR